MFGGQGAGPLEFDVVRQASGEFSEIKAGCLHGSSDDVEAGLVTAGAEVFASGVVFKSDVSGIIDCATGELEGELRGTYRSTSVCGVGLIQDDFFFKGPITAVYDPALHAFGEGTLTLHEAPVLIPLAGQPGGTGTWNAGVTDAGTEEPDDSDGGGCLGGVVFKDFTLDGGAP